MSYSRSYRGEVYYSGTVSYPASEHGGTVHYSGHEPVYISVYVDTEGFDRGVDDCSLSLNRLNSAVIATNVAQVESKRRTSAKIAKSIVKGFFNYVTSDLSQKMKELSSRCESLIVALMGHRDACLKKGDQMRDDYSRITKRYSKVFEDLDREMETRIETLDGATFRFKAEAESVIDRNSLTELLGLSTISASENLQLGIVLSCSHIKSEANKLLYKTSDYLYGTYKLANSISDMLENRSGSCDVLLPMIYVETNSTIGNEYKVYGVDNTYIPSGEGIRSQFISQFSSRNIEWEQMGTDEYEKIMAYLNSEIRFSKVEDRVLITVLDLIKNKNILTIKKD